MLRAIGKTCFAWGHLLVGTPCADPFIAGYHRVVENFDRSVAHMIPSMLISTGMLERHIDWLGKRFRLVSLDEIGLQLENGHHKKKAAAAITFDDGYSDVYHHALPLLKRKGVPAAVFVVTGLVGTGQAQVFDRLYVILRVLQSRGLYPAKTIATILRSRDLDSGPLDRLCPAEDNPFSVMTTLLKTYPRQVVEGVIDTALENGVTIDRAVLEEMTPLTWEMIETIKRCGFTIGSHTKSHSILTTELSQTVRLELCESKWALEAKLKTPVQHLAYPDGRFNPAVVELVRSAGYRYAYGICRSKDTQLPLLTIPRKVLWERSCVNALGHFSPAVMSCHTRWAFDARNSCNHDHSSIREEGTDGTVV